MGERGPLPRPPARRRSGREHTPRLPSTLTGEARAEWKRIVPELQELGVLETIDRGLLIRYCTLWADWVELDRQLAQTARLVPGQRGEWVRNPLWLMRNNAEAALVELGRQLMLSPASRLRAGIQHDDEQPVGLSPLDELRRKREERRAQ